MSILKEIACQVQTPGSKHNLPFILLQKYDSTKVITIKIEELRKLGLKYAHINIK